jgi:cell division protein FtsI/penicillin-binding protein 2
MKYNFEGRIKLIYLFFIVLALIGAVRLYFLQVIHHEEYKDRQEIADLKTSSELFDRGNIYFSEKDGNLWNGASLKSGYLVFMKPTEIIDGEKIYESLSKIIKIDKTTFLEKANKKNDPYEEIATKVENVDGEKIKGSKLNGIYLQKSQWRYYPGNNLASQTLGFVGYKNDILEGRYGLESYYEDNLKRDRTATLKNFFTELWGNAEKLANGGEKLEADIITTIEPTTERMLETEIENVTKKYGSKTSGGIIMDPTTGEIYAMASYPSFDPNNYNKEKDVSIFTNPNVERVFEMGSIIKPITMSAGLDQQLVTASSTYKDEGSLKVGDRTVYNFDFKGRGIVSMQEVLNQSLNTGAAYVALLLGKKTFSEYISNFGLGEETGIDLPGELPGLFKNFVKGKDVEVANAAFGQGIAMTPIATVRALSALGNGGVLPNPHIVKEIKYKVGISKKRDYTDDEMRRVIKEETSEEITRMLVQVFDKALKGGIYKMDRYSIAAKTGTAQIANKAGGGYYTDKFNHTFFGYFPAYNPKFIIFLYTEEPHSDYASNTLSEPFSKLAKFLINYYHIAPDR